MLRLLTGFLLALSFSTALAQVTELVPAASRDADAILDSLPDLARQAIPAYREEDRARYLNTLFRLQGVAGDHRGAAETLDALVRLRMASDPGSVAPLRVFQVAERARIADSGEGRAQAVRVRDAFQEVFRPLSDLDASRSLPWLKGDARRLRSDLHAAADKAVGRARIPLADAIGLIRLRHLLSTFETTDPFVDALVDEDDERRYAMDLRARVRTPDGAEISAIAIRPRGARAGLPTLLRFTIYADDAQAIVDARSAAARGYVGVVAYTRGKGRSPQAPVPYERDGDDARAVIAWVTRQPWSDGRVGMYGGSYDGFTQWAVAKRPPAALKTIVPYVANNPGNGLPMENNVFLFVNYAWPFYVTNNKALDNDTYFDGERWDALNERWYRSGASYRAIDRVDGTPNPWLQRWLQHPGYDRYWQRMTPFGREFAKIDIPVLTITGYFDDGQQSALHYLRQHYAHRPDAEHYLLIGPYDHGGAQAARKPATVGGYAIDPAATMDTQQVTFEWMDHVFHGAPRPALLRDRINYQVMGANVWRHAPSVAAMSQERRTLYLSAAKAGGTYTLSERPDVPTTSLGQVVDFADRETSLGDHYPDPVVGKTLDASSGLLFESAPFDTAVEVSGIFSGELHFTADRRDLDFSVTLYERMPTGELFHLSYFLGRASHADDMRVRQLLTPGRKTAVRFDRARMTSRRLQPGSRLVVAVSVNKNRFAQVNHGSGKDVSDEDVRDAGPPMQVQWHTDSRIHIPLSFPDAANTEAQ
ncbi:CocE/NonD family hydrolase [Aerolutibacter daejeonensis]|uniref:CocE/NonD family hydrolase n=1 Tax=Aerolutibacter daejeonensis TaxID=346181 RepID=UPI00068D219A|nr:CocE/NonD family hydrolase [Lysobacter daejeonensis]